MPCKDSGFFYILPKSPFCSKRQLTLARFRLRTQAPLWEAAAEIPTPSAIHGVSGLFLLSSPGAAQLSGEPHLGADFVSKFKGLGPLSGEENGNPLQCSCLENSMDRGTWRATIRGVAESDMTERLKRQQHHVLCSLFS